MSHRAPRFRALKTAHEPEWTEVLAQAKDGVVVIGAGTRVSRFERELGGRGVVGIGDNGQRRDMARALSFEWQTVVHPSAYVHPSAKLGQGTVVFAGAVVQPDAVIGDHVIVNTGPTIDHDCVVGDYGHLAPGVHLAGSVQVGEGAFLGIGSVVCPGLKIGRWATLGAGGVAIRDLADGVVAVGVPARALEVDRRS